MKKILVVAICCFMSMFAIGQIDTYKNYSSKDTLEIKTFEEKMPVFLAGGDEGMKKILSNNIVYPLTALKDNIGGRVIVKFTIDTTGFIKDLYIFKGVREDIDKEALRVVALLKEWKPAMQNNKKVQLGFTLPINFSPK